MKTPSKLLLITSTLLISGVALASGDAAADPHAFPAKEIGLHALNLALLLGVLTFFFRGKISDALKNRSAVVRRDLEQAIQAKEEAEARYQKLEVRLSGFEQELANMRASADETVAKAKVEMAARAKRDAGLIAESAQRSIRDETDRARHALRKEAAELALDAATQIVTREFKIADQEARVGSLLSTLNTEVQHG